MPRSVKVPLRVALDSVRSVAVPVAITGSAANTFDVGINAVTKRKDNSAVIITDRSAVLIITLQQKTGHLLAIILAIKYRLLSRQ